MSAAGRPVLIPAACSPRQIRLRFDWESSRDSYPQDGATGGVVMIEAFAIVLGLIGLAVLAAHALDAIGTAGRHRSPTRVRQLASGNQSLRMETA
jgi:hypothetical protein